MRNKLEIFQHIPTSVGKGPALSRIAQALSLQKKLNSALSLRKNPSAISREISASLNPPPSVENPTGHYPYERARYAK